tara:strand:- start:2583 stop:3182 length:600 start_codon:yes stop_codon:yes gene_type:complete
MKLLLENWREYLTEGMKMPEDLRELGNNIGVLIDTRNGDFFQVVFVEMEGATIKRWRDDLGHIDLYESNPDQEFGQCAGAWVIGLTQAKDGWGPMLYDLAIEMATLKRMGGGGVTPDRNTVSSEARRVWDYYLNNRSDIISKQLDNKENPQTPDEADDCLQNSAGELENWSDSALSKAYIKPDNTIMKKLGSLGKLIIR